VSLWIETDINLASAVTRKTGALSLAFADNTIFAGDAFFNAGASFDLEAIGALTLWTDGF
jgi:hypothetical protein